MDQSVRHLTQVTIIGHERPPRIRATPRPTRQLPAEFRSALELAQAAVWDWQVSADQFQVDEAWLRAFGIDVRREARCRAPSGSGASIPTISARSSRPADSCHHGGDRFECEYRLLAAGHRWLWVLHRGRVVQRERDGSAPRITGLLLDIDRRKSEEVARSDSESRLATALWGARAAFWQWHVPSNARTASPLWLAMTGYSRAQWDATPNPWFSNLHPDDRERVDRQLREHAQGERDSVEFEYRFQTAGGEYRWMQDRGRAVEWDLQGRPVLVIGVTLDIDAAKHAEAHLRSSESMLETAAWGAGIGLWETNFVTDTTRWFNDWCDRHDINPCDGDGSRRSLGLIPASRRRPGGDAAFRRTRRRQGRVLRRGIPHQDARAARGAGCSSAAAWSSAMRRARRCACSACAWTSTRPRSPSAAPMRATSASRRRCS